MKLLLDTDALLWWLADDPRLAHRARTLIADPANDVLVSVVCLWEIAVKRRLGKLDADIAAIETAVRRDGFVRLAITPEHLIALAAIAMHHRDPFDHLLLAQTRSEAALLVSEDRNMPMYDIPLLACSA